MFENVTLESKNNLLSAILAGIGDGVVATDVSGNITYFNAAAEEITGWSVSEVKNRKFYEVFIFIDGTSNQIIESPIGNVLKSGIQIGLEENSALVTKKGEQKYISANVSPIKDESGIVSGTVTVFRDITRIRSIELNLKEEQNNFIRIFNSAPVGIIVLNEDSVITRVNEAAFDFLDSNYEQSIGKRFGDAFFCQESFTNKQGCGFGTKCNKCKIKNSTYLALKSGVSTTNIEFSKIFMVNNQTRELWVKASITPMIDGDKKNAVIVLMDITDRKNREIALQKSRDFYLNMFQNFPTMIWKTDLEGNTMYSAKMWNEFIGKDKSEDLELDWSRYIHPEDIERRNRIYKMSVKDKQPCDMEYRILHSSGEYRWIQSINRPFYDINGEFDGYIGIGIDITDRKIAEDGLNRYKLLSEKVRDIIHFLDTEGNIIDVNQSALKSYGYTYEEFLKLNIKDIRAEGFITSKLLQKCDKEGISYETVHYRKDGSTFPVEVSSQGAEIGGERVLVSIIRDITERKTGENNLKAAKEGAESANKTKSEFLANMSHEIRTPINGIVGMVELTLLTQLNSEQKENLMIVKSCANSLLKVINDILDFSKMEAGKLLIENINFDIKSLVEEMIKAHSLRAITKGIELNYAFSSTIPQFVVGDPSRLQQILNNLISNAVKFTESGEVWVKIKKVNTKHNEVEVLFAVEDSGIGIGEENLGKLFESFSQLDGSITRRFGGTGLGLAISKQLSEMMGGRLWVESKKDIGSKFYFTLKFQIGTRIETQPVESVQLKKIDRPYNILLTEDDKVNQMVITRILKERGYSIDNACNGLEAVELCEKNSYDAILMDIQMPVMDGIEAAKRIREKDKSTPIIAITAYALKGDRERFLAQGMNDYVSKPIRIEELFSAIEKCLSPDKDKEDLSNINICVDESGEIVLGSKEVQYLDKSELSILDKLSNLIDSLNDAVTGTDISLVEVLAHKIKDLSNDVGIGELKTISFKMELAARRGDFSQVLEKAKKIQDIFEVFKKSVL